MQYFDSIKNLYQAFIQPKIIRQDVMLKADYV